MTTLAVTIAHKEAHWLDMWTNYYLSQCDKVLVLDQGGNTITIQDERLEVREFFPDLVGDWAENIKKVNNIRAEALERFDTVLFADVDEFLVPDPDYHESLRMYLHLNRRKVVYTYGWDVIGLPSDVPLHWSFPLLSQRELMSFNFLYGKPSVAKEPITLGEGGHHISGDYARNAENTDNTLWLFHFKMADWGEFKRRQGISHKHADDNTLTGLLYRNQESWTKIPERFFDCL